MSACNDCGELTCCYRDMLEGSLPIPSDQATATHLKQARDGQCPFYHKDVVR